MPFGKHKGEDIGDVPDDYLEWVLENVDLTSDALYEAIVSKLHGTYVRSGSQRRATYTAPPPPPPPPSAGGAGARTGGSGAEVALVEKVVRAWHRIMAKKYHPDRGGTHEQMLVVNEGAELLQKLAEQARG
jgi:hypothetical protein